jgi:hypothetical protein
MGIVRERDFSVRANRHIAASGLSPRQKRIERPKAPYPLEAQFSIFVKWRVSPSLPLSARRSPRRLPDAGSSSQGSPHGILSLGSLPNAFPLLVPCARALAMPAAMRSWMIERSNSANTPSI